MQTKTSMSKRITPIVSKCRKILDDTYHDRLESVVLYGSCARGEAEAGSDIDLLVLLNEPFDYFFELRRLIDVLYPVQLESDMLISAKPAEFSEYESGTTQLYRNAKRDGIAV